MKAVIESLGANKFHETDLSQCNNLAAKYTSKISFKERRATKLFLATTRWGS